MKNCLLLFVLLSLSRISVGQSVCSEAATAIFGTNAVPATSESTYWYKYTMPSDGKLQITSSSSNYVDLFDGTCDSRVYRTYGFENVTLILLSSGDEVLIKWDIFNGGDFDWNLGVSASEAGDDCTLPASAILGTNTIPETTNLNYWYSFTMPSEGKLQIASITSDFVRVYSNTCDNLNFEGNGDSPTITTLASGDQVFMEWNTPNGGNTDWSLSISPLEPGDDCSLAVTAAAGTNTLPETTSDYYWYTYTMPSEGKLQITSSTVNQVDVFSNSCDDLNNEEYGYGKVNATTIASGDQVYIKWETKYESDFDWNLSVIPLESGDNCSLAATATNGTNTVPASSNNSYWYSYTMPSDGKLQITSSSSKYVSVYSNACEDLNFQIGGYSNVGATTLHSGDQVLIKWNLRQVGDFDWDLSVVPFGPAESCTSAVAATTGTNTLPATSYNYYWYTYTMPDDGKLTITSSTTRNVKIYGSSCADLNELSSGSGNSDGVALSSGDEVSIRWNTYTGGDFDWNLSVVPFGPGDNCSLAIEATAGTNTTPAAPYWFSYTAPTSGNYTISSVGSTTADTYLSVYSDCNKSLLDQNDDVDSPGNGLQSTLSLDLTVGETIYILWKDTYSSAGFNWTLSKDTPVKTAQTITFASLPNKTLDAAPFDLTATASSGLPVSYSSSDETVATVSGTEVTVVGVGTTTITAQQPGDDTYSAAEPVIRVLTINKVSQTITINAIANQQVDASPISVVASTTSGLTLQYTVSGPATLNGTTITLNGAEGIVWVAVSQAGDAYYQAASGSVSFSVIDPSLQDQTITFGEIAPKTIDDDEFTLSAISSAGLPISYRSSDETVATVLANKVTIIGAGTTTITASQAGNETYRAASVTQVLTVTDPRAPTAVNCTNFAAVITETVQLTCYNAANGSLTASATGGESPYRYSLDGVTFQEAARFTDLDSGTYRITVKDASECKATIEATVTAPDALVIEGQTDASTESAGSGRITLSMSGGTAPYSYVWSNQATTATISNLAMGDYSVTVTDAQGCTATRSFTVEGVTALEDQSAAQVAVYPNPAQNVLQIDVPFGSKTKGGTLYDYLGRKVLEVDLTEGRNQLDVRALKPGSYLLKLNTGGNQRVMIR